VEAAALAPYPVAGDLAINGIWLSDAPNLVRDLEQAYDLATGEVTSRFTFIASDVSVTCVVVTFARSGHDHLVAHRQ
jgi:protein-glucosylgalactosylhydroxylysine glucosidase